ncbi:Uncharacterised protein [Sebaldella termitidis]|uniref:Uncharacterized protein n=1 Tax=Sebaldella termitidis (strain ATCC 33386 / NCTC 11300) TaxID=526218 RepID=D1AQY1_SEBTE|nr:hypothetical protein [Sebaldella termitidis]ACZ07669.1 hypothetical protein Sterm_0797 [Sebaldella termitidis ATCC 33386]SUI22965.1 Uncharacterised protein [Sebaldella termitidis]
MKKKIFIVFIILSVLLTAEGIRKMWLIDSRYGLDIGLRGDTLKVITWVDPQTNIEYLIFEDKGHKSLGISVVPRLNADGTLRIVK